MNVACKWKDYQILDMANGEKFSKTRSTNYMETKNMS